MEKWKDIPNTEYEVSSYGRVVKKRQYKKNWRYRSIKLIVDWKLKNFYIHRLVAQAFLWLDINNTTIKVCHKDDNILNNNKDNLFVGSQWENIADRVKKGRCVWNRVMPLDDFIKQTILIRLLYKTWKYTQKELGKKFKIWKISICDIIQWKQRGRIKYWL
jgi:hypothetical protein